MNIQLALHTTVIAVIITNASLAQQAHVSGPHAIVYKTKHDYRKLVPVVLSDNMKNVVSYPDPHDVKAGGKRMLPTELHKGYLLDNRGIGEHTAFLKMTWDKYAALPAAPSPAQLYKMIIDKDPMITICDCGPRNAFKHPTTELNKLVDTKTLPTKCKVIKEMRKT